VGNGPGSKDRTVILPCLRRIVQISHYSTLRADILSYLTDVSERLAQMIHFYFNNIFLCRLASDDCYGDYLSLDRRDILLWWICSTACDHVSRFE
jgi:hypothetical protein